MTTQITDMLKEFSDLFQQEVVVAGGCVRDTLLDRTPKDYDLFILNQQFEKWQDYKKDFKRFGSRLAKFPKVQAELEWHQSEPFLIKELRYKDAKVQLMASHAGNLFELLNTFDWKICRFGWGEQTGLVSDQYVLESIKPGNYLELHKVTYPFSTLRRGYRFSERFQMRLHTEDIKNICAKIVEKGANETN